MWDVKVNVIPNELEKYVAFTIIFYSNFLKEKLPDKKHFYRSLKDGTTNDKVK